MNQELEKTEDQSIATTQSQSDRVLLSDKLVPKLLLMQGLSEFVKDKKAFAGDFVKSTTGEKLGDVEVAVPFIPLSFKTTWAVFDTTGPKALWLRTEPRTAANENLPWEYTEAGKSFKRVAQIDVFALLPPDIIDWQKEVDLVKGGKTPDLDKVLSPVVITFRSTSYKAGKQVLDHFDKVETISLATGIRAKPYGYTLLLKAKPESNELGDFFVKVIERGEPIKDMKILEFSGAMFDLVRTKNLVVDESDETGAAAPAEMKDGSAF